MSNLALLMYIELDLVCIFLLAYILFKSFSSVEKRESWRFYQGAIFFILIFVLSDLIWALMDGGILPSFSPLPYLVNGFYFLIAIMGTSSWFFYTESEMNELPKNRTFMILSSIPLLIMAVLLAFNYNSGFLFYFDEQSHYRRGSFNLLTFAVPCLYLVFSVAHPFFRLIQKKYYVNRKTYANLASFSILTISSCIVQVFIPGTPLPCIGITLASLLVYINTQETLVSLDPLTKLNNRYHMVRYLSSKMEHYTDAHDLYLLIIDLDKFKQINDTYGHIEGDRALIRLADALRKTAGVYKCFISRYGGDEFIIIYETDHESNVHSLCQFLQTTLDESNALSPEPYSLGISIGTAKYHPSIQYIPEFIALADESLYQAKQMRR